MHSALCSPGFNCQKLQSADIGGSFTTFQQVWWQTGSNLRSNQPSVFLDGTKCNKAAATKEKERIMCPKRTVTT